jgi:hypothetical protein
VTRRDFSAFLQHVNEALGTSLEIPPLRFTREAIFDVHFPADCPIQARYLGRIAPSRDPWSGELVNNTTGPFDAIRLAALAEMTQTQSAGDTHHALERAVATALTGDWAAPLMCEGRSEKARIRVAASRQMTQELRRLVGAPDRLGNVPEADTNVVFVSLDLEWMEMAPRNITEVGLVFLDMAEVMQYPGLQPNAVVSTLARSHHLRVKEFSRYRNKRFCRGCPDKFGFG